MERQNVTISLSKETLEKVRLIASQRKMSLSALLTEKLEETIAQANAYEQAKEHHLALLKQGFDMGTGGKATWTRDELHERGD